MNRTEGRAAATRRCRIGVILAGGKGTRLYPITRAVPKELLTIGEYPIIDYSMQQMKGALVEKVYVVIGYRKEAVMDYLGNGSRYGVPICYVYQEEPLGPAHALLQLEPFVNETLCVVFGDEYLQPPTALKRLVDFHLTHEAAACIGVAHAEDARTTSIVKVDQHGRVSDIVEKPPTKTFWDNLGENGTHVFEPLVFDYIKRTPPGLNGELFLSDTVRVMVKDDRTVYAISNANLHLDIGVKERFLSAGEHASNVSERMQAKNSEAESRR